MYQVAPISLRVNAYCVDFIIVSLIGACFRYLLPITENLSNVLLLLPSILYFTIFTSSRWQATIGQRLFSIYVISKKEKKITSILAFDRHISQMFFPILGIIVMWLFANYNDLAWLWFLLMVAINICIFYWYLIAFKKPENQTIHDYIFDTVVVIDKRN